jgi:hypothetical protein
MLQLTNECPAVNLARMVSAGTPDIKRLSGGPASFPPGPRAGYPFESHSGPFAPEVSVSRC